MASCHKAIAIIPDYAEARNSLGNTLLKLGQYEEGLKYTRHGKDVIEFNNDKSRHFQLLIGVHTMQLQSIGLIGIGMRYLFINTLGFG